MASTIEWSDFEKMDMRVGTVISAEVLKKARKPAYVLEIDFGTLGIKTSSAQITTHYNIAELPGKQIIGIVNFPTKRIAGIKSECLVLGVYKALGSVILVSPDQRVENGLKIG